MERIRLAAGAPLGEVDGAILRAYSPDYMLLDPATFWPKVKVPVLAVWGEKDRLVPANLSRDRIEKWLREAGNEDHTLRVFPDAGHGIALIRGEDEPWDWPRLAPGYHELLVKWTRQRAGLTP